MKKILLTLLCLSVMGCSKPSEPEKTVDVLLIGGGIMSASLGTYLNELEPDWSIDVYERMDKVAEESSNAWNNAGTGHSAFCELNYTSEAADGSMDISKAVGVNEQFEISKQFWAYQVEQKVLNNPTSFINNVPHMSFVWGDKNVEFLKKRHAALQHSSLFRGMEYSEDHAQIQKWLHTSHEVRDIVRNADNTWTVVVADLANKGVETSVKAKFVFIGAGGGALKLLQKSGIP
uniref:Malate dehydrogenase (quinone) n=1 Tax=Steinernema glaseri TaxID=37863 RepID=A0A1I7YRR6_9BILA